MTFARPSLLVLVALAPLIVVIAWIASAWLRQEREGFARGAGRSPSIARWLGVAGAVVCLAVALAGPRLGERFVEVPLHGVDVVFVVDASRSMAVADEEPDRIGRARREIIDFANQFDGGRLGLVLFGGDGRLVCPLTRDRHSFEAFVREIDPAFTVHGGTDVGAGVERALDSFGDDDATRVVVIVSDGEHLGDDGSIGAAAWTAYHRGVTVHALMVGTREGGPIPLRNTVLGGFVEDDAGQTVQSRAVPDHLAKIAARTGGLFLSTQSEPFPLARLRADRLDRIRTTSGGTTMRKEPIDRFRWALVLALSFLLWPATRGRRGRLLRLPATLLVLTPFLAAAAAGEDPEATELAREGVRCLDLGDAASALTCLDRAAKLAPGDARIAFDRGAALYRLGRFDDAAGAFDRGMRGDPRLRAKAAFGAGVARARAAEAIGGTSDAPPTGRARLAAVSHLRVARENLIESLRLGHGRDAAIDLELVTRKLRELESEPIQNRKPDGGEAGTDPPPDEDRGDEPDQTGRDEAGAPSRSTNDAEPADPRGADENLGDGSVDGEPGTEDPRLVGGLFRERARSIEDVVKQYERERVVHDLRRARAGRRKTERDW